MMTEQKKTITVNPLPAKTWNWLRMNETQITDVRETEAAAEEKVTVTLVTEFQNVSVEAASDNYKELCRQDWDAVESGMGREMEDFCRKTDSRSRQYVKIEAGVRKEEPLVITCDCEKENANDAIFIYAGADSEASVIITSRSRTPDAVQAALNIKIIAEKNAKLHLSLVQLLNKASICLHNVGSHLNTGAEVEINQLELGGKEVYAGICYDLSGDKSQAELACGYYGSGTQKLDYNFIARHHGKKTVSNMEISGILRDAAEKLMRGTIDFIHGCSGAKGDEKEEVLLIGDDMVNRTIPLILCAEEDVEGNHGASIGKLEDGILFYAASRGISPEVAEELIARARIEAVSHKIPSEEVQNEIFDWLKENRTPEKTAEKEESLHEGL